MLSMKLGRKCCSPPKTFVGIPDVSKHPGSTKFLPRFIGPDPFKVAAKIGPVAYCLQTILELPEEYNIHNVFHVSLLKKYHSSGSAAPPSPPDWIDGDSMK